MTIPSKASLTSLGDGTTNRIMLYKSYFGALLKSLASLPCFALLVLLVAKAIIWAVKVGMTSPPALSAGLSCMCPLLVLALAKEDLS
jgi:hypothetical protein